MMNIQSKSVVPQVLDAVSVFLCPLKIGKNDISALEKHWQDKAFQYQRLKKNDQHETISTYTFPALIKEISFGTKELKCSILPGVAYAGVSDWVVLALEVTFNNLPVSFDDLLLFNVGFRRTQGNTEQQDSFFDTDTNDLKLTNGASATSIYNEFATELFSHHAHLPKLTKAILLSYAKFDISLTDDDLYRFGTVAYANEPASSHWTAQMRDHVFDRWSSSGWRCFVHSYSLVYALANLFSQRQDQSIRKSFLREYLKIGVAIAIQRAWLQEFLGKIKNVTGMKHIRDCHNELVRLQSYFGSAWTSEGTQRMQIEQMWRNASGVDNRMSDARVLLEQKVAFEEAIETERLTQKTADLNRIIYYFQFIFGIIYGAQIGLSISRDNVFAAVIGGVSGFFLIIISLTIAGVVKNKQEKNKHGKGVFKKIRNVLKPRRME